MIDFWAVSKKLYAEKILISIIATILDQIGSAKWFSIMDLKSRLYSSGRRIPRYHITTESFSITQHPFGLKVNPNSFQRMMSIAFEGITQEDAFLYNDDLIITGCSKRHHLSHFDKHNLKLNPIKCRFFQNNC